MAMVSRSSIVLAASALLLAASLVHAGEFDHKNVAQYTGSSFKDKVCE